MSVEGSDAAMNVMFVGHDPFLVALSVAVAILGGYTGFGLAGRIRSSPGANPRLLLAGAAGFLAVSIWTMHFVGVLAAPIPPDTAYLVFPTVTSFLICALVVGISLFFVSIGDPSRLRIASSALLLGIGIASMHYVGIHGLTGHFAIEHEPAMVLLSVLIAIAAAYGGLRIYLAHQGGFRLALSAVAFGIAVSGMHYTAMYGMHFRPANADHTMAMDGLTASPQVLSLVVALLCFLIAVGFLLFLVPEARQRQQAVGEQAVTGPSETVTVLKGNPMPGARPRVKTAPLAGLGQPPRSPPATRIPLEISNGTQFIDTAEIRSIRADAHYTLVHDGLRERMSPWSISEMESQLCPADFMRVHRSHIVAVSHITLMRKEGDGAVVELDGPVPHRVPVSRAKMAELKARLGLTKRDAAKS